MKKKTSFIKLIQLWGIVFLLAVGGAIIVFDNTVSYWDFHDRTDKIRADYITRQKEMIKQEVDQVVAMIEYEKNQSEVVTKRKLKSRVYEAHAIAQHIYQQNKTAKNKTQIKQMIIDALRPIRFDEGSGYYFATRLDGVEMLFADKPELEGLNLLGLQDTQGKYVVKDMIRIAQQSGQGFYEYHWTKPEEAGKDFKKISFIKHFEPFDWFIGAGMYVDDVKARIKAVLLSTISRVRFGKEGYIFVNRLNGDALVSNGKHFSGTKKLWQVFNKNPEKMKAVFEKEYKAAAKPEGGYIYYSWVKLSDPSQESPKTSFIYGIPDLQWLVGAGIYLDDVETDIAVMHSELNRQIKAKILSSALIVVGLATIFLFSFRRLNRKLKNDFNLFISFFNRAAHSNESIDRDLVQFSELDLMAENANKMLQDKMFARQALLGEQEALRESEEKYRLLASESPDLRYRTDKEGNLIFVSQSVYKMTGYTEEEAIGMKMSEFYVNPEERALFLNNLRKEGYLNNFVVQLKRKNDTIWWASLNTQFYKDQDGNIIGVDGVVRDVSEHILAEQKLRLSEEKYRSLTDDVLDTSAVGIFILDFDFKVVWVNQALEEYFGLKRNELTGKDKRQLIHEKIKHIFENPDDFKNKVFTTYDDNTYVEHFECHILPDGEREERWLEHRSQPIKSGIYVGGRIEHYYDITEIKRAQEALQESELKFREMANLLPQVVYEADIQGNFTFVNEQAYKLFGYSQEDVDKGINVLQILIPEDIDKAKENIKNILGDKPFENMEYTAKRKDGSTFSTIIYSAPIIKNSKPVGLRGIIVDISERKQMEEESLKVRKLESVGVLAGGIAHDFNNILAAILGNISLSLTITDPQTEIYELLTSAEKASLRAKDLTQQLLTFSKGGEPVKKIASIDVVIRDSAGFVLRGSNVGCDFKFGEALWPLAIDTGQISQVIQNIIINANQAMPTGGTIVVDCSNYILKPNDNIPVSSGNYIKIAIKDQGIGIPADMLNKVFDPYFTTKQKGNGLGLAIIHSIISKHDGYINVDSEPGRGTTFTIYLPASQGKPRSEQEDVIMTSATAHGRIMIMDDEEMIRELVEGALSRIGYEVVTAEDGEQAVRLYQLAKEAGAPIDLIIMDLTIPGGMGGKEAIKEIHKIDPEAKVIVSSGYSNDPVMADFGESGFCGAMVKPFQMRELRDAVGKAVSS